MNQQRRTHPDSSKLKFEFPDRPREELLRELILYIAIRCADDETFGATKLNKILFFSDFESYAECGEPITGVAYQRLEHGPAPERLLPIRNEMEARGELQVENTIYRGFPQQRPVALREPDLSMFSARDLEIVDYFIEQFKGKTASDVSILSHRTPAWQIVENNERIPYNAVFLSNEGPTEHDIALAKEMMAQYGW